MRPVHHLPDIGDQRRQDQQRRRLDRRQDDRQQAHRDGGQTQSDDALGKAGQEKDREDEGQNRKFHGPPLAAPPTLRNAENTRYAFGLDEG